MVPVLSHMLLRSCGTLFRMVIDIRNSSAIDTFKRKLNGILALQLTVVLFFKNLI